MTTNEKNEKNDKVAFYQRISPDYALITTKEIRRGDFTNLRKHIHMQLFPNKNKKDFEDSHPEMMYALLDDDKEK